MLREQSRMKAIEPAGVSALAERLTPQATQINEQTNRRRFIGMFPISIAVVTPMQALQR
jgi:hypothetical protein